jgi:nucleoside-diphosphate-sugar epimerase
MPYGVTGKKVLVTGGTGFMGSYLVKQLSEAGNNVKVLARENSDVASLKKLQNISIVQGDICVPSSLPAAITGVDIVYHLAALLHLPSGVCSSMLRKVNVDGTRNLLEACRQQKVGKFIYFSTAGVPLEDEMTQDDLDPESDSPLYYGESKFLGEKLVNEYHKKHNLNTTILRPVVVYGFGDQGNMNKLINAVRKRWFVMIGDGSVKRTLVYVKNVINAAFCVTLNPKANGKVYLVTDGKPLSIKEIAESIAEKCNISLMPLRLPLWAACWLASACDLFQKTMRVTLPFNRDLFRRITHSQECSSRLIEEEMGFVPLGFREGISETIDEMDGQSGLR